MFVFLCVLVGSIYIFLHDPVHLRWCDTCVERSAKTDNDCFIVSIFAEGVQSPKAFLIKVLLRSSQICTWAYNTKPGTQAASGVRKIAVPSSLHACPGKTNGGKCSDI